MEAKEKKKAKKPESIDSACMQKVNKSIINKTYIISFEFFFVFFEGLQKKKKNACVSKITHAHYPPPYKIIIIIIIIIKTRSIRKSNKLENSNAAAYILYYIIYLKSSNKAHTASLARGHKRRNTPRNQVCK